VTRPKNVRLPRAYELVALADTAMQAKASLRSIRASAQALVLQESRPANSAMLQKILADCDIALAGYEEGKQ
jgi:hypothetical protein